MTGSDGKDLPPRAWARERILNKAVEVIVGWVVITFFISTLAMINESVRGFLVNLRDSPALIKENSERLDSLERLSEQNNASLDTLKAVVEQNGLDINALNLNVDTLSQPEVIFEVSQRNSGPVEGFCVERAPCLMQLRIRRKLDALDCKIAEGVVRWGYIHPITDAFTPADMISPPRGRNIGVNWENVEVELMTPSGLSPDSDFVFEAGYTGCPGMQPGDSPITRRSAPFPVRVLQQPCNYKISKRDVIHDRNSPQWERTSPDRCFATRADAELSLR